MPKKVAWLLDRYPFLGEVFEGTKPYFRVPDKARIEDIKVMVADPNLVCHIPLRVDRLEAAPEDRELRGLRGTCWEELWICEGSFNAEREVSRLHCDYFKSPLLLLRDGFKAEFLIKVRLESWSSSGNRRDEKVGRVYLTLYKIPSEGLRELILRSRPDHNVFLSTRIRIDSMYCSAKDDFLLASNALKEIGVRFNAGVYANGLRELLDSMGCPTRGQYEDVTMLTIFTCGRCLVNLVRGDRYIALAADDEPGRNMGAVELEGTIDEIREITETVIRAWNSLSPEERASAQTKGAKISFLGL